MLQKWKVYLFSQLKIKENPPNLQIIQTQVMQPFSYLSKFDLPSTAADLSRLYQMWSIFYKITSMFCSACTETPS